MLANQLHVHASATSVHVTPSKAVVVPFAVSEDARGLGLGLAALLHHALEFQGATLSLAQLFSRDEDAPEGTAPRAVEACIPPESWRDVHRNAGGGPELEFVVTGTLDAPTECGGAVAIHGFDPRDGTRFPAEESILEFDDAGTALVALCERALGPHGFNTSALESLRGAPWEAIESLLRGERMLLRDSERANHRDVVAALVYLRRALSEHPPSSYLRARVAQVAFDLATHDDATASEISAAERALDGALLDVPECTEFLETLAAIGLRSGKTLEVDARLASAIANSVHSPRIFALRAESLRHQNAAATALEVLDAGLAHYANDGLLRTERGATLRELGRWEEAEVLLEHVLVEHPRHPAPYVHLASIAERYARAEKASALVDHALSAQQPSPLVLRAAINLALSAEPEGLARAARVGKLAEQLARAAPSDPWPHLMLARAAAQQGDGERALRALARVRNLAPDSAFEAEALRGEFAIHEPGYSEQMDKLVIDAQSAAPNELAAIVSTASDLTARFPVWTGWLAQALAEQRLGHLLAAKVACERAIEHARGATPAWLELGAVLMGLGESERAVEVAMHARTLEGDTPPALRLLVRALAASGKLDAALVLADRIFAPNADPAERTKMHQELRQLAPKPALPTKQNWWTRRIAGLLGRSPSDK
jgi:tetratricopeptide (TPR) repeat protein